MFGKRKEKNLVEQEFINQLFNFIMEPEITERERKIGLLAKQDIENKRYVLAVLNQLSASFRQEALSNDLTPKASAMYKNLREISNKLTPIGTS